MVTLHWPEPLTLHRSASCHYAPAYSGSSYKRNHTMCGLYDDSLSLMFSRFIQVAARVGVSFLLIRQIPSHCMDSPHFIFPLTSWWVLGLFLLLGFYEQCCSEHGLLSFLEDVCFPFLDIYLGVELQGHDVTPCLTFWETCKTVFQSSCTVYIPSGDRWKL